DDRFLLLGREPIPRGEVVHVLLHHDVAATRDLGVLLADERRLDERWADGIRGTVHEAEQVARVEVAEPDRLVGDGDGISEQVEELALELEDQIVPVGADVEEEVSGRRDSGVSAATGPARRDAARSGAPSPRSSPKPDCR